MAQFIKRFCVINNTGKRGLKNFIKEPVLIFDDVGNKVLLSNMGRTHSLEKSNE